MNNGDKRFINNVLRTMALVTLFCALTSCGDSEESNTSPKQEDRITRFSVKNNRSHSISEVGVLNEKLDIMMNFGTLDRGKSDSYKMKDLAIPPSVYVAWTMPSKKRIDRLVDVKRRLPPHYYGPVSFIIHGDNSVTIKTGQ